MINDNDYFDPQQIDEQIADGLVGPRRQETVANQVIQDLHWEYQADDRQQKQAALQRVWQRIEHEQSSIGSYSKDWSHLTLLQPLYAEGRNRPMRSSSLKYKGGKYSIALFSAIAVCLLIIASMVVTLTLFKNSSQSAHSGRVTTNPEDLVYTYKPQNRNEAQSLIWSPDGQRILAVQNVTTTTSSSVNGTPTYSSQLHVRLEGWDATSGQGYQTYVDFNNTDSRWTNVVSWSPDSKYIAYIASSDWSEKGTGSQPVYGKVVVVDAKTAQVLYTSDQIALGIGSNEHLALNWSSDSTSISVVSHNADITQYSFVTWNIKKNTLTTITVSSLIGKGQDNTVLDEMWSPDGKYVVLFTKSHLIFIDGLMGGEIGNYTLESSSVSPAHDILGWRSNSGQLAIFMVQGSQVVAITPDGKASIKSALPVGFSLYNNLTLSPDGNYLATYDDFSNKLDVWSLTTQKIIKTYQFKGKESPTACNWSSDGKLFAIATFPMDTDQATFSKSTETVTIWKAPLNK